ncbi:kinase [Brevundimonas sp.]|uniref:kinase n=1 Tax=Brevundimonas sp. TaxID=1871086 RepID=UPI002ED8F74D
MQLSLDDVYLTKTERAALAAELHPLFSTRGPPGTHDLELLDRTVAALSIAGPDDETPLPVFDKLADERVVEGRWPRFRGRPRAILIDGWCLGALPEESDALASPLNRLETERDPDGVWRRAVNAFAGDAYLALAERLDARLFLRAPGFDAVLDWRCEQEADLRGRPLAAEERHAIADFIQCFERLTRRMIDGGVHADIVVQLDRNRQPVTVAS